ncbi:MULTISPECIES: hypothetical protein [unclassified Pseudovibrio]|uniref:hypothetical protein n=1 Tax=unclassified Pseudovibrio TaxID=2627060 RepID=UPI0007AE8276|nr:MULTISPECIES: hypothetical protein [unclassified Pseudovibrio]
MNSNNKSQEQSSEETGDLTSKISAAESLVATLEAKGSEISDPETRGYFGQYVGAAKDYITQAQQHARKGEEKTYFFSLNFCRTQSSGWKTLWELAGAIRRRAAI